MNSFPDRPYQPIDCDDHDRLETLAITRRTTHIRHEVPGAGIAALLATINDVYTQGSAEYVVLDNGLTLRLDALQLVDGKPVRPADDCGLGP